MGTPGQIFLDRMAGRSIPGPIRQLSRGRFYIEASFTTFFISIKPLGGPGGVSAGCFDLYVVDGLVDLLGQVPRFLGYVFQPLQNGLVQFYALMMVLGLAGFLLAVLLRW